MTRPDAEKPMLIALTEGLAPYADTLVCDDLRGPRSLFGESVRMPRPLGGWDVCHCCLLREAPTLAQYEDCSILWRDQEDLSALERAGRIVADGWQGSVAQGGHEGLAGCSLDLPARTFLAGCSTSSFALAWKLLEDGLLPEWAAVICSCQTEGRGRLRRPWHSPRGNLYVTFRLPENPLLQGDAASLVTGLLLVRAFTRLGFSLSLKWPNDLLLDERGKAGGVLLEEKNGVLLAGLGVNLAELPDASLLKDERGTPATVLLPPECVGLNEAEQLHSQELLAPFPLWRMLLSAALLEYQGSIRGRNFSDLCADIERCLAWKGRRITVEDGGEAPLSGIFLGLGQGGGLKLGLDGGGRKELFSGSLYLEQ